MTKKALLQAIDVIRRMFEDYINSDPQEYKCLVEACIREAKSLHETVGVFFMAGIIKDKTYKAWSTITYDFIEELREDHHKVYGYRYI